LLYSFQDTLDRHVKFQSKWQLDAMQAITKATRPNFQEQDAGSKRRILHPAAKHEYETIPEYQGATENAMQFASL
jgi:hypothetical protein